MVNEEPPPATRAGPLRPAIEGLLRKDPPTRPGPDHVAKVLETAAGQGVPPRDEATVPVTAADLLEDGDVEEESRARPEDTATSSREMLTWGTEREAPVDRRHRAAPRALVLAGLGVVLGAAFVWLLSTLIEPSRENPASPAAEQSPQPDEASPSPGTGLPEGWIEYRDDAVGYTISHPEGWEVSPVDDTRTDFQDPQTGTFLRVDWTDRPGADPVAAWESYSRDFAAQHEGYREIRIDPAEFQGYEAAEWEFTFQEGGTTLHALDLGFVTGEYGFALFFEAPEEAWAGMQDEFEAFKASFRAPS